MKTPFSFPFLALMVVTFVFLLGSVAFVSRNGGGDVMSAPSGIGGGFSLTDQDGKPRTEKDYAGHYKLIYFGYTFCPSICPTELQKMSAAYTRLPVDQQGKIKLLFISVDPDRDTPDILKNYTDLFHKGLIGFTGTQKQIDAVKRSYQVYSAKVIDPETPDPNDDYAVDHSSYIYFTGPDDKLLAMFKGADTAGDISGRVQKILTAE
jgi:protein SCO1/2